MVVVLPMKLEVEANRFSVNPKRNWRSFIHATQTAEHQSFISGRGRFDARAQDVVSRSRLFALFGYRRRRTGKRRCNLFRTITQDALTSELLSNTATAG